MTSAGKVLPLFPLDIPYIFESFISIDHIDFSFYDQFSMTLFKIFEIDRFGELWFIIWSIPLMICA